MPIVIREADLSRELGAVMGTVNENFGMSLPLSRFEWLYLNNPDGQAIAWFAVDDASGDIVGSTAVSPRRVRLARARKHVVAWNCGDFSITKRYRSLGAAVKLRRAARDGVDAGQSPFLYAHPNERMLAVHLRVGHQPLARMVRYARPLSRPGLRKGLLARGTSAVVDLASVARWIRQRHDVVVNGEVGDDFTRLYETVEPSLRSAVVRDRTYLEWRFRRNPAERAELVETRLSGRLTGYVWFIVKDRVAHVKDWLAMDPEALDQVFAALIRELRRRDTYSISLIALETHPDLPRLRRLGFVRRPDFSTAVAYAPDGYAGRGDVIDPAGWYMTAGDRDV